jgi:hypothetical protein
MRTKMCCGDGGHQQVVRGHSSYGLSDPRIRGNASLNSLTARLVGRTAGMAEREKAGEWES